MGIISDELYAVLSLLFFSKAIHTMYFPVGYNDDVFYLMVYCYLLATVTAEKL